MAASDMPFLQPGEEILIESPRHRLSVLDEFIAVSLLYVLVVGAIVFVGVVAQTLWFAFVTPAIATFTLLLLWFFLMRHWRVKTSRYVVTPERVYKSFGRLRWFLGQTTYDKLTDLHIKQSFWGRRFGFGTIRLETAGAGLVLEGVSDPFAMKQRIESARASFIHLLAEGQRKTRSKKSAAPPEPDYHMLWQGGPTFASVAPGLITAGIFTLGALALIVAGFFLPFLFAVAALALVLAGSAALGTWVQYRFLRFEVGTSGVVVTSGWLSRRRVETTYEKVTDVTTYQSFWGRMFGFGRITVNTAGSNTAPVVFDGVGDPEAIKTQIDDARRAWRNRR